MNLLSESFNFIYGVDHCCVGVMSSLMHFPCLFQPSSCLSRITLVCGNFCSIYLFHHSENAKKVQKIIVVDSPIVAALEIDVILLEELPLFRLLNRPDHAVASMISAEPSCRECCQFGSLGRRLPLINRSVRPFGTIVLRQVYIGDIGCFFIKVFMFCTNRIPNVLRVFSHSKVLIHSLCASSLSPLLLTNSFSVSRSKPSWKNV
jgi:hypothetical protein